jgi:hypothetical protein
MLIQCCVCKGVLAAGEWQPADAIIYEASHTYCPSCAVSAQEEIRAFKRALHGASRPTSRLAVALKE